MTEYPANRPFPGRKPTHPGAVLREDVLPDLRMSPAQFAEKIGVSRQMLRGILAGQHAVTPEVATRLGRLLGGSPSLWLRMQQAHDFWRAGRPRL
jgi:addiction module HigA family antidote